MKEKIVLEYPLNASPKVLFPRLSTPGGLAEWFADDVNVQQGIYSFIWNDAEQKAKVISKKENKSIRFHWLDDDEEESYFEFKLNIDELTGDLALIIIDFVEADEKEDSIELWNTQITELKHTLGS